MNNYYISRNILCLWFHLCLWRGGAVSFAEYQPILANLAHWKLDESFREQSFYRSSSYGLIGSVWLHSWSSRNSKLHAYGLAFVTVTFLLTYLKEWKRKVSVNNISSLFEIILSVVPQGSLLSPIYSLMIYFYGWKTWIYIIL